MERRRAAVDVATYEDSSRNPIRWTCRTLGFFRGCSPASEGCKYCYAVVEGVHQVVIRPGSPYAKLVKVRPGGHPCWTGVVEFTSLETWLAPFKTRQPWLAFTNSMSDVFHENLSDDDVLLFFRVLWRASWHTWQLLTKRAPRMADFMSRLFLADGELHLAPTRLPREARYAPPNVWVGVTVENQQRADERLPHLLSIDPAVRFVSMEPLLGPVDLSAYVDQLHWLIVGGESAGPEKKFRPMDLSWALEIRDLCVAASVPFFFKQLAGLNPGRMSKELDGRRWEQLPHRPLAPVPSDEERRARGHWVRDAYAQAQQLKSNSK